MGPLVPTATLALAAAITDVAFADDQALKYSLAVLPVIVCPLAALLVGRGLKDYRWALNAAGNT
ncbi:MAG: hypothetical protein HN739_10805 [Gammaproteobacteria bacterium]|nr:hypothetical protein [Gammaproteobacteria bacterium]